MTGLSASKADPARPTAGLRGASWTASRLPKDLRVSVQSLRTQDGAQVTGFLYYRGGEKAAGSLMHPRQLVAPHPGPGKLVQNCIDPSVIDEKDPAALDAALFPFSAENGFREPPESARYSEAFVARYRSAQRERVARIDAHAKAIIEERQRSRAAVRERSTLQSRIGAAHTPIFQVWRTDADLRCFDLHLEPSDRKWGTVWGADPFASNYGSVGFCRSCTAESWLSS